MPCLFAFPVLRWPLTARPASACPASCRCCFAQRVYQARKHANEGKGDVVFNQLQYQPTCTHMPTCKEKCEDPTFIWRKKAGR